MLNMKTTSLILCLCCVMTISQCSSDEIPGIAWKSFKHRSNQPEFSEFQLLLSKLASLELKESGESKENARGKESPEFNTGELEPSSEDGSFPKLNLDDKSFPDEERDEEFRFSESGNGYFDPNLDSDHQESPSSTINEQSNVQRFASSKGGKTNPNLISEEKSVVQRFPRLNVEKTYPNLNAEDKSADQRFPQLNPENTFRGWVTGEKSNVHKLPWLKVEETYPNFIAEGKFDDQAPHWVNFKEAHPNLKAGGKSSLEFKTDLDSFPISSANLAIPSEGKEYLDSLLGASGYGNTVHPFRQSVLKYSQDHSTTVPRNPEIVTSTPESLMPPASKDKGQKEFVMPRPPAKSLSNIDKWIESWLAGNNQSQVKK